MSSRACADTGSLTVDFGFLWRCHERTEWIITDALTWPVSRMAAATRRTLANLLPPRITDPMEYRTISAVALRARVRPSSRTRVRCSGARPAMNMFNETASRAMPRIREVHRRRELVFILDDVAVDRRHIGLRPQPRARAWSNLTAVFAASSQSSSQNRSLACVGGSAFKVSTSNMRPSSAATSGRVRSGRPFSFVTPSM